MNVRRALGAATTAALLVGLAACGGGDDNSATQAAAPAADAAAPAAEDEPGSDVESMADNTSPGTGADAYAADDPFVAGKKVTAAPKTIVAAGFAFTPLKVTAKPGEEWTLDNQDVAKHNVQTVGKNPAKFKSPDADPGQKVKFKMPAKPGKYKIDCEYHGAMVMDITLK